MKQADIRSKVYKVIALAVKNHSQSYNITVMQNLEFYDHLPDPMAELVTVLAKDFDYSQLGDEVLKSVVSYPLIQV